MPALLSKPGILAICGWLCATAGLPAGVLCQDGGDQPATFEVARESVCEARPAGADSRREIEELVPADSSDCSDTPIGLEITRRSDERNNLVPAFVLRPVAWAAGP